MKGTTKVLDDGNLVVEVLDREQHLCSEVYKITSRVGTTVSDEELPDCSTPTQHESHRE